jgi:hypothetical protein
VERSLERGYAMAIAKIEAVFVDYPRHGEDTGLDKGSSPFT